MILASAFVQVYQRLGRAGANFVARGSDQRLPVGSQSIYVVCIDAPTSQCHRVCIERKGGNGCSGRAEDGHLRTFAPVSAVSSLLAGHERGLQLRFDDYTARPIAGL